MIYFGVQAEMQYAALCAVCGLCGLYGLHFLQIVNLKPLCSGIWLKTATLFRR